MILGAITGVPTPACLSATSNPVEAVTPPQCVKRPRRCTMALQRTVTIITRENELCERKCGFLLGSRNECL